MPYLGFKVINTTKKYNYENNTNVKIYDCMPNCWNNKSLFLDKPVIRD